MRKSSLFTIAKAAQITGVNPVTFWKVVYDRQLIGKPRTKFGHRKYYSQKQMETVIATVNQLRAEGEI